MKISLIKYFLILIFFIPQIMFSQQAENRKNSIDLSVNRMFFTYGDARGTHFSAAWRHTLSPHFSYVVEAGIARCEQRSELLELYPNELKKYPPTVDDSVILAPNPQAGLIDYPYNHHDQQTAIIGSTLIKYNFLSSKRNELSIGAGPSVIYVNKTYISYGSTGTFRPTFSTDSVNIFLIIPVYERFLDLGFQAQLEYKYKPVNNVSIGTRATMHNYFSTGYLLWSAGIVAGFEF